MIKRWWTRTVLLADFIKTEFLEQGKLDIQFDEIAIAWRASMGGSLGSASDHVDRHISAAGDYLREQGWYITNVTDAFFSLYGGTIPSGEDDLKRCIPGLAGADGPTRGWHARKDDNTELSIMAYFRDLNSGNGKVAKATRTMADALAISEADPAKVDQRNNEAHLPTTMAQMKRVQKHSQPPPALPAGKKKP